jgi:hypothetical protein
MDSTPIPLATLATLADYVRTTSDPRFQRVTILDSTLVDPGMPLRVLATTESSGSENMNIWIEFCKRVKDGRSYSSSAFSFMQGLSNKTLRDIHVTFFMPEHRCKDKSVSQKDAAGVVNAVSESHPPARDDVFVHAPAPV